VSDTSRLKRTLAGVLNSHLSSSPLRIILHTGTMEDLSRDREIQKEYLSA
jgi:hypothetical protein